MVTCDVAQLDDRSRLTDCIDVLLRVAKVLAHGADTFGSVGDEAGAWDDRHAQWRRSDATVDERIIRRFYATSGPSVRLIGVRVIQQKATNRDERG
jgi:hypothetical protein